MPREVARVAVTELSCAIKRFRFISAHVSKRQQMTRRCFRARAVQNVTGIGFQLSGHSEIVESVELRDAKEFYFTFVDEF